jgi:plasmid replication initiation protein
MAKLQVQSFAKLPNKYVFIERSRGLTILEEKLIYMLINSMQKRFESTKKIDVIDFNYIASDVIKFDDFTSTMQIGSANRKEIGERLKGLLLFALAIREEKKDRFLTMFSEFSADYETNSIEYKFNDSFIKYFTGICRDYFTLEIQEVISLNSSHAIRIYQLLKSKLNMDDKEHKYTIVELKKLLNIETKYTLYSNFKQCVLEVAKQQINASEVSKFSIDYIEIKKGKSVVEIEFKIISNCKNYYVANNKVPNYKLSQLQKKCLEWLKDKNSIVRITAEKLQAELKMKKPLRATIAYYLDVITSVTGQEEITF